MSAAVSVILAALAGYVLGSLSISCLYAKTAKGIDLAEFGRGFIGAGTIKERLGLPASASIICFDIAKAVGMLLIARYLFNLPDYFLAIPAGTVILGHVFPLFFHFRGGRGTAAALGMAGYLLVAEAAAGRFCLLTLIAIFAVSAVIFAATRDINVVGMVAAVFVVVESAVELGFTAISLLITALSVFLFIVIFAAARSSGVFRLPDNSEIRIWRIAARPFALLFIAIDLLWNRQVLLFLIGILALIFIVTDLIRLGTKFRLKAIFKNKEFNRFSSMTLFLVSVFLTFLLFPVGIPYIALICITFGDFASKMIGMRFGTKKIYKSRTIEGTLGFLAGSFMFTYVLSDIIALPLIWALIGCVVAALVELFSENIDDNFTVSIVTGGVLAAVRYFMGL